MRPARSGGSTARDSAGRPAGRLSAGGGSAVAGRRTTPLAGPAGRRPSAAPAVARRAQWEAGARACSGGRRLPARFGPAGAGSFQAGQAAPPPCPSWTPVCAPPSSRSHRAGVSAGAGPQGQSGWPADRTSRSCRRRARQAAPARPYPPPAGARVRRRGAPAQRGTGPGASRGWGRLGLGPGLPGLPPPAVPLNRCARHRGSCPPPPLVAAARGPARQRPPLVRRGPRAHARPSGLCSSRALRGGVGVGGGG
jgi:hypothetical protein